MKNLFIITLFLVCFSFYAQTTPIKTFTAEDYKLQLKVKTDSLREVIKNYDKAIALNSKDDKAYFLRGTIKQNLASYAYDYFDRNGAINDFTQVIKLKSKYADTAYYRRAQLRLIASTDGKLNPCYDDLVFDDLIQAVKTNPTYAEAWHFMGDFAQHGGKNYAKAIEYYTKVIEINKSDYYIRGICKEKLANKEGACADWNIATGLGNEDAKIKLIQSCGFIPKTAQDYYLMIIYGRKAIKKKVELDYCNKSLALDSISQFPSGFMYNWRGSLKLHFGDTAGACADWHKSYKTGYTTSDQQIIRYCSFTPKTAKDYLDRAIYRYDKNYKLKIEDCTKAIELDTTFARAYLVMGSTKISSGDTAGACLDWKKAYELGDKSVYSNIYKNCGFTPKTAEDFYYRAIYKRNSKEYKQSIEDCDKAIELNLKYGEAYFIRAYAKYQLGDKEGACLDYKKSDELGFGGAKIMADRDCN